MQGACSLLETCGAELDPAGAGADPTAGPGAIKDVLVRLEELAGTYPQPRMRFLMMDVMDLRKRKWVPKHPKAKPKKLSEKGNLKQVPRSAAMPQPGPSPVRPRSVVAFAGRAVLGPCARGF